MGVGEPSPAAPGSQQYSSPEHSSHRPTARGSSTVKAPSSSRQASSGRPRQAQLGELAQRAGSGRHSTTVEPPLPPLAPGEDAGRTWQYWLGEQRQLSATWSGWNDEWQLATAAPAASGRTRARSLLMASTRAWTRGGSEVWAGRGRFRRPAPYDARMGRMRTRAGVLASVCLAASVGACGATPTAAPPVAPAPVPPPTAPAVPTASAALPAPAPLADGATWDAWRRADEVVLAPRRFASALAPLVKRRESQGHVIAVLETEPLFARFSHGLADPRALQTAVRALAAHAPDTLRFVLLVGDYDEVPTFYLQKLAYEHHSAKEHANPYAITRAEHTTYPSDDPYAMLHDAPDTARLAVGRIPARGPEEAEAFVGKLVAYETRSLASSDQSWRRRVTMYAGDPYFGDVGNNVVKTVAEGILDQDMSYDYDLRLTFAKDDSPYAYGFDRIEHKLVADLDDGAVVAAYVGHGSVTRFAPAFFRGRDYEVGTSDDAASLRIAAGKPVFFSIACDTGAFDRPGGLPSLAERMVLNPDGPIAVFASSRESHPYPNALYGQQIIRHFVNEHPATLGDGILAIKDGMVRDSMPIAELLLGDDVDLLKREHVGLYNLFGDPATKLRYAEPLTVTAPADAGGGAPFSVEVAAPAVADGKVHVTLETRRATLKGPMVRPESLSQMTAPEAFAAMARNNALANDKVVASADAELRAGHARVTLRAPADAGDYVVKALATGTDAAAGHAQLHVRAP